MRPGTWLTLLNCLVAFLGKASANCYRTECSLLHRSFRRVGVCFTRLCVRSIKMRLYLLSLLPHVELMPLMAHLAIYSFYHTAPPRVFLDLDQFGRHMSDTFVVSSAESSANAGGCRGPHPRKPIHVHPLLSALSHRKRGSIHTNDSRELRVSL